MIEEKLLPKERSTVDKLNQWKEIADKCSNHMEPVIYYCDQITCPNNTAQPLYCLQCLSEGNH